MQSYKSYVRLSEAYRIILDILYEELSHRFICMLIAVIELWGLILPQDRFGCKFFLPKINLILAEDVFAEILWQV